MKITKYSFVESSPTEVILGPGRNHLLKVHTDIRFGDDDSVTSADSLTSGMLPDVIDVVQQERLWGISPGGTLALIVLHYPR